MDGEDREELRERVGGMVDAQEINGHQIRNMVRTAIAVA